MSANNPQFPLFIPTKGRADSRLTAKVLEEMGVFYTVVVEEQEYDTYAEHIDKKKILVLDKKYQDDYDTCDELGNTKSKGPGPARPNYSFFVIDKWGYKYGPFTVNTRIYSCNLIRNDVPFRWRGRYNEDTDLSLQMLKAGWCTVQFNVFLQEKTNTQVLKGGNTDAFYAKEGTVPKSQMQVKLHPDVSKLTWRYGRWHHHVNYNKFKRENRLILRDDVVIKQGVNDYGLTLKKMD